MPSTSYSLVKDRPRRPICQIGVLRIKWPIDHSPGSPYVEDPAGLSRRHNGRAPPVSLPNPVHLIGDGASELRVSPNVTVANCCCGVPALLATRRGLDLKTPQQTDRRIANAMLT
jgi:hypothetical protein